MTPLLPVPILETYLRVMGFAIAQTDPDGGARAQRTWVRGEIRFNCTKANGATSLRDVAIELGMSATGLGVRLGLCMGGERFLEQADALEDLAKSARLPLREIDAHQCAAEARESARLLFEQAGIDLSLWIQARNQSRPRRTTRPEVQRSPKERRDGEP